MKGLGSDALKQLIVPYRVPEDVWLKSFSLITGDDLLLLSEAQLKEFAGLNGVSIYNLLHAKPALGAWCRRRRWYLACRAAVGHQSRSCPLV